MTSDQLQFVGRRPRHEVIDNDSCRVWVELASRTPSLARDARLVNLSRHGLQISVDVLLAPDERLVVHIADSRSKLHLALPAQARWLQSCGEAMWSVGCVFDSPIGYEAMGELFLSGILDTETHESLPANRPS